ncbi:MAG: zinc ABC transporter solute-binding protein [Desulfobacteraceae bacterium]|nr:zinc ABC transporter solute-binding protein [Desulfobacteraceae bacterium]MBC2752219.1 zinc ABC transporter substrate-binding protein [Desulfobacteraceae bacterium]
MNRWKILISLWFVMGIAIPGMAASDRLPVFVSVLPQQYFVQQIGGQHVDVQVMVQPGASPATYEPRPRQMTALADARLYFSIGVAFEAVWLDKITAANPSMTVVRTDDGIEKIPMAAHHHDAEEAHHEADAHHAANPGDERGEHGILDPHIWLSPPLVRQQAGTILKALTAADPGRSKDYETNYRRFVYEIDALDRDLKTLFSGKEGLPFMVFHPAWGYFAQAYGLTQVPIEIEGKDPKPAQLQVMIENARTQGIRVVFVQPQFSVKRAELVAREIGGQVAVADPLALDWLTNLRAVAGKFKAALQ